MWDYHMTFIESAGKAILKKENLSAYANLQVTFGATMSEGKIQKDV